MSVWRGNITIMARILRESKFINYYARFKKVILLKLRALD